jgi:DNA-binding SARP family transcriptional activator/Tfp pilus assembly protein PilF
VASRSLDGSVGRLFTFELLGPLEVRIDGDAVPIRAATQRLLLASLLVDANQVVPVDELVGRLWGEKPPAGARSTLHSYVMRLRRVLGVTAEEGPVFTRPGGYLVEVAEDAMDIWRFSALVRAGKAAMARGEPERAAACLRAAQDLWRGEPLLDCASEMLRRTFAEPLAEQRLAAIELRIEADLHCGRHHEIISELTEMTARYPLRESFAEHLMLALYRCGRNAEALETFHTASGVLADELGVDPGRGLRDLYHAVLTDGPAMVASSTAEEPAAAQLRQLPPSLGTFTGRTRELADLATVLGTGRNRSAVPISVIGGTGGIGKTSLALHWAHTNLHRFPDGQLYVNLRGFDPAESPMPWPVAIRGFLDALGVAPDSMPTTPDAQAGLYRSLVAGKRLLIVLDNARDTPQIEPLLPGSPACTVLVTSRRRLGALVTGYGAVPLRLDALDPDSAQELLARQLGSARVEREPQAVRELVACCAGLPLALAIVAARAGGHGDFPLAMLAMELRDAAARLGALDAGEPTANLPAVFATSYNALGTEAAMVFRLLGLVPAPDIGLPAIAALAGVSVVRARERVRTLESAHLVTQHTPGRYRMHDLVRLYAADRAGLDDSPETRDTALRRLLGWYIHTARGAEVVLARRPPVEFELPGPGWHPQSLTDARSALTWFRSEHPSLLALQRLAKARGWDREVWRLTWTMGSYHWRRGHPQDNLASWMAGLDATTRLDDQAGRAQAHRRLGLAHARVGDYEQAFGHLRAALRLCDQLGDVLGQSHTYNTVAWALARQGDDQGALGAAMSSLRLIESIDDPLWIAEAVNLVGWYAAKAGRYAEARMNCESALDVFVRYDDRESQADTLDSLGYIEHRTGNHAAARDYYDRALAFFREVGHTYEEANTLNGLGDVLHDLGRPDAAAEHWQQALDRYRTQQRSAEAEQVQRKLTPIRPPATG